MKQSLPIRCSSFFVSYGKLFTYAESLIFHLGGGSIFKVALHGAGNSQGHICPCVGVKLQSPGAGGSGQLTAASGVPHSLGYLSFRICPSALPINSPPFPTLGGLPSSH